MSEDATQVRFGFNGSLRVAARGEKLTGNAGALLLREVDDRVGVTTWLSRRLYDPRSQDHIRYDLKELLRTRLQLIALGYRDQGDSDLLRRDPVVRLAVSESAGLTPLEDASGLASQPTMSRLIDMMAVPQNLHELNSGLMEGAIRCGPDGKGLPRNGEAQIIDLDSFPVEVHGHQAGSEWNGHFGMRCYHPLVAMLGGSGHWLGVELRPGNVHTADGSEAFLAPIFDRLEEVTGCKPRLRGDAGFPGHKMLSWLEQREVHYVFRVRNNSVLDALAEPHLRRPPGRRPKEPREWVFDLDYKAKSWDTARRVVLVVQERANELFLHHFFLVTNASRAEWPAKRLIEDYRQRGTMEARLGELNTVLKPALSCTTRGQEQADTASVECRNAATLLLFALAYNLAHTARRLLARATRSPFGLDRVRKTILAVPALVVTSARRATIALNAKAAALWTTFLKLLGTIPKLA